MLVVTLLVCLIVVVFVIAQYSKTVAVIIWFLGSGSLRTIKHIKPLQKLNSPQIQKLDLLDTEYAAIVAASQNTAGDLLYSPAVVIKEIVSYRTATKQSVKDMSLYRLGNCLQLFGSIGTEAIALQNRRLNEQQVKKVLFERFGVML